MLKQELITENKYNIKAPYNMDPIGICIHNTANDASARNEVTYMKNNNYEVSFHIAIDDIEAIQAIPFNRNTWHAGDGGTGIGNRRYISIEICYSRSGGDRFIKAEKRAVQEVALLLKKYGWGIDKVKKHQDFSNKYCPHRTLDMGWNRFLNMIQEELNLLNNSNKQTNTVVNNELYRVRRNWGDIQSQKGAFKDLENAKKVANQFGLFVFNNKGEKIYPVIKKTPDKYLNLNPHMYKWNVYPINKAPVIGNQSGTLTPNKFGGLSYKILGNPQTDVYTIQTESFGKVNIYAPRDRDSSISNNPIY